MAESFAIASGGAVWPIESPLNLDQIIETIGGYAEAVYLTDGVVLLVNEDARSLDLPVNLIATAMTASRPGRGVVLLGTVVLTTAAALDAEDAA